MGRLVGFFSEGLVKHSLVDAAALRADSKASDFNAAEIEELAQMIVQ